MVRKPQGAIMNNYEPTTTMKSMKDFYAYSIREYTPNHVSEKHRKLINEYKAPSENYLNQNAHNKRANKINMEDLDYLIKRCRICPLKERYRAIIILMYQIHEETSSLHLINNIKAECIPYLYGGQYV